MFFMTTPLISVPELQARLTDVVIVDCRFDLMKPAAGEAAYASGHIPGARYAHLDRDLSSPITPTTGRHPLPDPEALALKLGTWGVSNTSTVVAYDADNGMFAARLWWLLRWLGQDRAAVLDGGLKAWLQAQGPMSIERHVASEAVFTARRCDDMVVSANEVAARVVRADWRVLDARADERYRGEVEPIDAVAGHIPGARNHPFALNLNANGQFLPPAELSARYRNSLTGVGPEQTIAMCGSGVTACHTLLALEVAGMRGAKLYAGSWSEWIRDPQRPVARG